jgi:hypothetical protein
MGLDATGSRRLLDGVPPGEREQALRILAARATFELEGGAPHFGTALAPAALLLVADGFVVVRATAPRSRRAVVTCEAGPGHVLLPPSPAEVLVASRGCGGSSWSWAAATATSSTTGSGSTSR